MQTFRYVCLESKIHFPPATSMFLEVTSDACDQTLYSLHDVIIISTGNLLVSALVGRWLFLQSNKILTLPLRSVEMCHNLNSVWQTLRAKSLSLNPSGLGKLPKGPFQQLLSLWQYDICHISYYRLNIAKLTLQRPFISTQECAKNSGTAKDASWGLAQESI